jgi:hypothetical protein|nr:MAG TPA_asm: ASCH domain protein [Caudoviricetes sp.]
MAIKQILMRTEMVRAILDGRKTCTRRIVKSTPSFFEVNEKPVYLYDTEPSMGKIYPPCQPGDILYVRETWGISNMDDESKMAYIVYRASEEQENEGCREVHLPDEKFEKMYESMVESEPEWRPSIHMPKEAARIWLKVTDVRVERLQDMTDDDAEAEGMPDSFDYPVDKAYCPLCKGEGIIGTVDVHSLGHMDVDCPYCDSYRKRFENLWNSINQKCLDCYGWDANPWVWVIEFERCEKPKEVEE